MSSISVNVDPARYRFFAWASLLSAWASSVWPAAISVNTRWTFLRKVAKGTWCFVAAVAQADPCAVVQVVSRGAGSSSNLDEEDEEEDEDDDEELAERALSVVALNTDLTAAVIASSEYFLCFFSGAAGVGTHKELRQHVKKPRGGAQSVPAAPEVVALVGRNVRVGKPRAVLLTVFRFCLLPPGSPMVVKRLKGM
jgi:hypothetical protein